MRERLQHLRERHSGVDVALSVSERYGELQGATIAAAVTLALFLSLFPLLLVATSIVGYLAGHRADFTAEVVARLGLDGAAATTFTDAIAAAQRSRRMASIVGFAGLVWSGLGAIAALQSAVDRSWQATGRGVRDRLTALWWLAGTVLCLAVSLGATALAVVVLPTWAASLAILVSAAGNIALFWWTFKVLSTQDVGWRPLLPGSIAGGIGFLAMTTVGAWIVPHLVARSSALYGSIGVIFALLAWLFVFGRLFVYSSALNVVLYERGAGTVTVEVDAPRVVGQVPTHATRSGVVDVITTAP